MPPPTVEAAIDIDRAGRKFMGEMLAAGGVGLERATVIDDGVVEAHEPRGSRSSDRRRSGVPARHRAREPRTLE